MEKQHIDTLPYRERDEFAVSKISVPFWPTVELPPIPESKYENDDHFIYETTTMIINEYLY